MLHSNIIESRVVQIPIRISSTIITTKMYAASLIVLAFAATGFAQAPEGYRTVYVTSMVDPKFVLVPKAATAGSTLVVYVS